LRAGNWCEGFRSQFLCSVLLECQKTMGAAPSSPEQPAAGAAAAVGAGAGAGAGAAGGGAGHNSTANRGPEASTAASSQDSACPVINGGGGSTSTRPYMSPVSYNVYGQPVVEAPRGGALDPRNNMPLEPNQQPSPGQQKPLSTERCPSIIPKGGVAGTWTFPSPQMVFNGAWRVGGCACVWCGGSAPALGA